MISTGKMSKRKRLDDETPTDHFLADEKRYYLYDYRSTRDLKRFIEQRTGRPVEEGQEKHVYAETLVNLDNAWRFRFFDLPPEIRNNVCYHLLTLRPARRGNRQARLACYPAVLRINSQAHTEAQALLYANNVLSVVILAGYYETQNRRYSSITQNLFKVSFPEIGAPSILLHNNPTDNINVRWPMFVQRSEPVTNTIKFIIERSPPTNKPRVSHDYVGLNHIIHSLTCGQHGLTSAKQIRLIVKPLPSMKKWEGRALSVLYPLTCCKRPNALEPIEGLPEDLASNLRQAAASAPLANDRWKVVHEIERMGRKATRLLNRGKGDKLPEDMLDTLKRCVTAADRRLDLNGVFIDADFYNDCDDVWATMKASMNELLIKAAEALLANGRKAKTERRGR
ncbi:hypothetical protein BAUCODRAFT_494788 [Baudoinia panamericana UAMH 10762]|uniref:Uncharacterized protein n=1 Tax=Baudoinia panamericana (strain UAMH 10762) TaxID=717646 RepID=M2N920_BAUPA|nr:uncharacterized protein BAUCODRAFT_494788 [Baudoinia panamericana UAMH 10762]EMC95579.1 hypothetical protein BAUCODRAFT_494788 [Baudoinia panamericana UAMH 10762]